VAEERPLLCVIDDAQALDEASARTLAFVARRLLAESVGMVFATCEASPELLGLPELHVRGLRNGEARQLLDSAIAGPLDAHVRDQIVAETRGTLVELIEAAARTGDIALASTVLERLSESTQAGGCDMGLGTEARCRALLSDGAAAERLYRRPSSGSGALTCGRRSPAHTSSMASGCAASAGGWRRERSCVSPTSCSPRWGWTRSPPAPGASCSPRASGLGGARSRRAGSSPRRRR
jgi:hypothetical protein